MKNIKTTFFLALFGIGLILTFINKVLEVSQPPASVQYEQHHRVKLKCLKAPAKNCQESHCLYFLVDSSDATNTLSQLMHIGVFADTVSQIQVLQTQADTIRVLLPKHSGSLIDKISHMQITEDLVLLSFYTNVMICSDNFDNPTDTLKRQNYGTRKINNTNR